jgi:murein L,D-transpeptidase YcbB/YkuD
MTFAWKVIRTKIFSYSITRCGMTSKGFLRVLSTALAVSIALPAMVETAEAQRRTLLEMIFPNAAERLRQQRERENRDFWGRDLNRQAEPARPVKRVTGPRYYTYKPEALAAISLAAVLPKAAEQGSAGPHAETILHGEDDWSDTATPQLVSVLEITAPEPTRGLRAEDVEGWSMQVEADVAKAMRDHYAESPDFLWVDQDGQPNLAAKRVMRVFGRSVSYGLTADDYVVGDLPELLNGTTPNWKAAARFELAMTSHALRYAADANDGAIDPNGISGYHDFPNYNRDYAAYMEQVAAARNPARFLEGLHPDNKPFKALRTELSNLLLKAQDVEIEPIATGTFIKPGQTNPELPKVIAAIEKRSSQELRDKHSETLGAYSGSGAFSDELVSLVKDFQSESGLVADGIIGRNTVNKLQMVSPLAKIERVRLAMERLRWLPHTLGNRYVFINQPAYRASYVVNGNDNLSMRAIVGKPANQTSFFHDTIELVEVNPYWNVPRSILVNEMLGNIRQDPGYLYGGNYEVVTSDGHVVDPYNVDWYSSDPSGMVRIRQRPGGGNALGELKILFPNKHHIYMHDTPSRNLFSRSQRALSHGCVRLQKPRDMAAAVLGTSVEQVGNYIAGGQNQSIKVENKLPVYVSYFTAWPADDGSVGYYTDIYGRDKSLLKALESVSAMRKQSLETIS